MTGDARATEHDQDEVEAFSPVTPDPTATPEQQVAELTADLRDRGAEVDPEGVEKQVRGMQDGE